MATEKQIERFLHWWNRQGIETQQQLRDIINGKPAGDPAELAAVDAVLDHLNRVTGRRFRKDGPNRRIVRQRLREPGNTVATLRAVVAVKARQARQGRYNPEHLRPATLFKATLFSQYVAELPQSEVHHEQAELLS